MLRSIPKSIRLVRDAAADYGVGWLASRVAYEAVVHSGFHARRFPRRPWDEHELLRWLGSSVSPEPRAYADHRAAQRKRFFVGDRSLVAPVLRGLLGEPGIEVLRGEADRIVDGELTYFSSATASTLAVDGGWHANPFTGQRLPSEAHWTRVPVYSPVTGDIKYVWEPGRFGFAYTLARAYWATDDERFPEAFWRLAQSWVRDNPPNTGAHWKDGQEIALRLMAWCFALHAFDGALASTPERVAELAGAIGAQADRIDRAHTYAELQRNNHAISEGVGLWTVGLLFPELTSASRWREHGRAILTSEAVRQIAPDGSYIQNSTNYHRVMLHDYLWALALGKAAGDPLPASVADRVGCAADFLYALQDEATGCVPNYGNNDGALVLPLSTCAYEDFRPVVGAARNLAHGSRTYAAGPWDEEALWLLGPQALDAPQDGGSRTSLAARDGGYYALRGARGFGVVRCVSYSYRPGQADLLHVDLWHDGVNVACDAGTYRYYDEPPWNGGLGATAAHNTVEVGGADQMAHGPHFMWLRWAKARARPLACGEQGTIEVFQGEHDGYRRLDPPVTHRRSVLRAGDALWVVVDDLMGEGTQLAALQWLLSPADHTLDATGGQLRLDLFGGATVQWRTTGLASVRADVTCGDDSAAPRGWRSRYYGIRESALSLRVSGVASLPGRFVTVFVLDPEWQAELGQDKVTARGPSGAALELEIGPPSVTGTPLNALFVDGAGLRDQVRLEAT
jgi:asparagine synthase (glutamine-hydrolysing)